MHYSSRLPNIKKINIVPFLSLDFQERIEKEINYGLYCFFLWQLSIFLYIFKKDMLAFFFDNKNYFSLVATKYLYVSKKVFDNKNFVFLVMTKYLYIFKKRYVGFFLINRESFWWWLCIFRFSKKDFLTIEELSFFWMIKQRIHF